MHSANFLVAALDDGLEYVPARRAACEPYGIDVERSSAPGLVRRCMRPHSRLHRRFHLARHFHRQFEHARLSMRSQNASHSPRPWQVMPRA